MKINRKKDIKYEDAEANNFSIHTLEVRAILTRSYFDRLFRRLSKKYKKKEICLL